MEIQIRLLTFFFKGRSYSAYYRPKCAFYDSSGKTGKVKWFYLYQVVIGCFSWWINPRNSVIAPAGIGIGPDAAVASWIKTKKKIQGQNYVFMSFSRKTDNNI